MVQGVSLLFQGKETSLFIFLNDNNVWLNLFFFFFRTMPYVMVLSSDGYFYSYSIDLERGGECSLMKQYR